jgi:hypothetical protein
MAAAIWCASVWVIAAVLRRAHGYDAHPLRRRSRWPTTPGVQDHKQLRHTTRPATLRCNLLDKTYSQLELGCPLCQLAQVVAPVPVVGSALPAVGEALGAWPIPISWAMGTVTA